MGFSQFAYVGVIFRISGGIGVAGGKHPRLRGLRFFADCGDSAYTVFSSAHATVYQDAS